MRKQTSSSTRILAIAGCAASVALAGCGGEEDPNVAQPKNAGTSAQSGSGTAGGAQAGANETTSAPLAAHAATDAAFARVLKQVVSPEGRVQYRLLANDELASELAGVVAGYATAELPPESPPTARLALWCNAYNANVLQMASEESRKDGFKTVKDVPGFFDQRSVAVAGTATTLDALEDRLRELRDPRIHAVIVRGAMSSPALRFEPYVAERLDEQFNEQTRAWLEDLTCNRLTRTGLMLNKVFEWRAEDFEVEPYNGVRGFLRKRARPNGLMREFMRAAPDLKIEYMEYDWKLNDAGDR